MKHKLKTKIIVLTLISINAAQAQNKDSKETLDLIKSLVPSLGQKSSVKTSGCGFNKKAWTQSLLTQQSFKESITYNKDCDLQGTYQVAPHKYFPLNYSIKNHPDYKKLDSTFKYGVVFEDKPTLRIEFKKAKLSGKKSVVFNFTYDVFVNPMDKDPLKEHKGGTLNIISVNGKKLNKSIPVNFGNH